MRKLIFLLLITFVTAHISAQDIQFSAVFDSTVTAVLPSDNGAGDEDEVYLGIEEYANLRLKSFVGDYATFYGAFNVSAAAGSSGFVLSQQNGAVSGDNYVAAIELERLYIHFATEHFGLDAGLFRLAFGYGQVFGPSDFLNPRNPLFPDARPRAILGAAASFYPTGNSNLRLFAAWPKNPFTMKSDGFRGGISGEVHGRVVSVQGLFAAETASDEAPRGVYRAGLSFKADVEVGLFADALYVYAPETASIMGNLLPAGNNGLATSAGVDYTIAFAATNLYLLTEYLYSSPESVTALTQANTTGFTHRHYLYAFARYSLSDYTSAGLSCLAGLEDATFSPEVSLTHEFFQGGTLSLSLRVPLGDGELGPGNAGRAIFTGKFSVRI
jgi:hypothetical protein